MVGDVLAMVVAALMTVPGSNITPHEAIPAMATSQLVTESHQLPQARQEMRGVWVTTVINLDFPTRRDLSNAQIKREIDYIIEHSRSIGLNAIFLQVRPAGDAIYPSAIFPWSKYITGEQGRAPADGFDPLAYWIQQAHANGLELHAWINPYRVTHTTSNITDVNELHPTNPARLRPDLVFRHLNRPALYLDPGFPESRQLIIDGVAEILRNYPTINGIHFDDYFYPSHFDDSVSFAMYGQGMEINEWRRNNVNLMIQGVQQTVQELAPHARFGISPTGIWQNRGSTPLGSDTRGNEHFRAYHADSIRWIQEGWIDYIIPQIYWHIGFDIACYEILLNWWADAVRGTDVDLYIGHAAWREQEGQANFSGEMLRQLQMNTGFDNVAGSVFFRWTNLDGPLGDSIRNWYAGRPQEVALPTPPPPPREPVVIMTELTVVSPGRDITVNLSANGHNVFGASLPHLPLYMNGEPVTDRTPEGFYFVHVPLVDGVNVFEFTQPGQPTITRRITRSAPAPAEPAPPAPPAVSRVYTEPYYATVTAEVAWLFPNATITGGSNWLLERGMRDRIIGSARDGRWLQLSNGGWIEAENVERSRETAFIENILGTGTTQRDGHIERISWPVDGDNAPVARAVFESGSLTVYFGMQTEIPVTAISAIDSIFGQAEAGQTDSGIIYLTLTPRHEYRINGYDIFYEDGHLVLEVMTPRPLYPHWRTPFSGFTFVIDPGHGGSDYGALGPMGTELAEKHIVLQNAFLLAERLRSQGAEVHLFREENDTDFTLRERVLFSRQVRPDMFLSLHTNSVVETTDASNIRGFTVWYRNESSYHAARTMLDHLHYINPYTNRWKNPHQANFYVCRPTWVPSVLLEASFMPNIEDFAWMINPAHQEEMADTTVIALISYFLGG